MNVQLIVHNVACIISAVVAFGLVIFILLNNRRKAVNIALALTNLSVGIFYVSHLIGVNTADPYISRNILMANVCIIFVTTFFLHTGFLVAFKHGERKYVIRGLYVLAIALALFYLIFPDTFLLPSVPKMYFPNYYVPGSLHWVMRVLYNGIIPFYYFVEMLLAYRRTKDPIEVNRFKYLIFIMLIGYVLGGLPILLVFNIPVDPTWGILFAPLYAIPMVYAIVTYDLVDIKIIARKAFLYGIAIFAVGAIITTFNFSNQLIREAYPEFPFWVTPLVSSFIVVGISIFIWNKLRQNDILKYEFVTTVTHKFRTPLTHIKWASENMSATNLAPELKEQVNYIQSANLKLVELTNLLMNVSESEGQTFEYDIRKNDISKAAVDVIDSLADQITAKKIRIIRNLNKETYALFDESRIKFIMQTFIENAIHYSREHATVNVMITRQGKYIRFSVIDNGIGISKEELPLLFAKFYRGHKARVADTEGMGIGLFIAKEIIARHNGQIWAESPGEDKGSTFSFTILAAQ